MENVQGMNFALGEKSESCFTGGAIKHALRGLAVAFGSIFSLFIAYPFLICWYYRWANSHTYINGRRLAFDGKGSKLFLKFLLILFLSLITAGIYFLIDGRIRIITWITEHTHFEGTTSEEKEKSCFTGKWYQFLGVELFTGFITLITLFLGFAWAHCRQKRWLAEHTRIDGYYIFFDGEAFDYLEKYVKWTFISVITLGIGDVWVAADYVKWKIAHTYAEPDDRLREYACVYKKIVNVDGKDCLKTFCKDCDKEITSLKCLDCGKPVKIRMGIFTLWGAHMTDFPKKEQQEN
ncbi:MAG: DUF898 domain-containing protein [Clostridia bacterium]|nr:DUF898 domain-containing protein [Clostridia bacterium]